MDEKRINDTVNMNDEEYEGYFYVSVPIVNVKEKPGFFKRNRTVLTLMNTQRVMCYGEYTVVDDKKWFKIEYDGTYGYVIEDKIEKL